MAVEVAIDTNRYRDFVDGVPEAIAVFRAAPKVYVPFVVVAELRAGFAVGSRGDENQRIFEQFLHRPRIEVLLPPLDRGELDVRCAHSATGLLAATA